VALRFQLLGHIRAFVHGQMFAMTTPRKTPQLLAYLLLNRGATVSRDYLAFLFWPDDTEDAARTKLRSSLFDLSRALPPANEGQPWISADGTSIRWNAEADVSVDVDEFDAAVAEREHEAAVHLYDGDLLQGLYDEWLLAPRERLRGAYLSALSGVISEARRAMNYPMAISHAKRLLLEEPLREDAARRLMALRYEAGDRAGALDEYARFADRLREELGIEPMPETATLHATILSNEPLPAAERSHTVAPDTATRKHALLPFVGRQDELSRLLDGWNRAARGRGGMVLVDGAPGIGKSRLVAELARCVEDRGGRVLAGVTGFPEAMPYQALLEALRGASPLLAAARLNGITLRVLSTLLPELEHLVQEKKEPLATLSPEAERARALSALARAFVVTAEPRPVLLIVEDLHWAQDATIAALAVLVRRTPLSQLFIVGTYRDGDVDRHHALRTLRAEILAARWGSGLTLRPLTALDIAEVARKVAHPLLATLQQLHAACAGNPLLLDQLLAAPAPEISPVGELRLDAIVGAQFARLSERARAFAEIAALVGTRFPQELVREVGGWDAATASEALDELLDRKIVSEASGYGDFDYSFAHQLTRDAVAELASGRRAADRHRRIARALEALYPEREAELAAQSGRHYDLAGDRERAASRFVLAGRRALAMSALEEARAALRRGLELATDPQVRADGFMELIEVSRRRADPAERSAALTGLDEAVDRLGDAEYRRKAALLRVQFSAVESDAHAAEQARDRLRTLAADGGARWRAALLIEDARAAFVRDGTGPACAVAEAALEAAREAGDPSAIAHALVLVAQAGIDREDFDGSLQLLEEAQEMAFRAGDGAVELQTLVAAHRCALEGNRVERCAAIGERWLERARALGDRELEALARVRHARTLVILRRDVRRALDDIRSPTILEEIHSRHGVARVQTNRGIVFSEVGDFPQAAVCFEEAARDFEALGNVVGQALSLSNLALERCYAGEPDRGHLDATAALRLVDDDRFGYLRVIARENFAITSAFCNRFDEAVACGVEVLATQRQVSAVSPRLLADLATWSARRGDLSAARGYIDEMLTMPLPVASECVQTHPWAAAQILRACGETAGATAELERAHGFVATLAMELDGEDRTRFEAVPWNREIVAAHDRDEWPPLASETSRSRPSPPH
jgi:DNA-binding SARP family transcriptional activator/tetratricopeptide (TPR) repeat protein